MAWIKKTIIFVILFSITYIGCKRLTDGFALGKIQSHLPYNAAWETSSPNLGNLLDQPFYYLGHGAQNFAFLSKDGKYVIKFYRHHHAFHILKPLLPALPSFIQQRVSSTLARREEKRETDFTSFKIASDALYDESGMIFAHLNRTNNLHKRIVIFDKIRIKHTLDLDQMTFILQKRASHIYPTLEKWIREGDLTSAKTALSNLVALLKTRMDLDIYDKDPDLKTNFGFIDTSPIQFDIGRLKYGNGENPKEELIRITDQLCAWLDKNSSNLAKYLRDEIDTIK